MPKFSLNDYTGVNDRMRLAADTWQSINVSPPVMLTDLAGYVSATVTLKDGRTVTEIAAFRLGLTGSSAQANFPIEDAATSAVGRALGRFGFGTDTNFPSREEMQQVERVQPATTPQPAKPEVGIEQAADIYWNKFAPVLGARDWSLVQRLLDTDNDQPTTLLGWRKVWTATSDALAAEAEQA